MSPSNCTENDNLHAPERKRLKSDKNVLEIVSKQILNGQDVKSWDTPYPHGRLESLFVNGFLEQVLEEVKNNSKVKFKESDLFRVYQSIDLGNLSESSPQASIMPSLMRLKAALYSPEFRAFVEKINKLEPGVLTEQVDCAANCHAPGCHLLCHDDVIGTRKVSYIIYLTEKEWTAQEGGALELYDSTLENNRPMPNAIPAKTILPTFNSMAYFVVEPGLSFHAVQQVFGERPRLSIQGWYHAKDAPDNSQDATLCRLKSTEKGEDTEGPFHCQNWKGEFSNDDHAYLSQFINKTYLEEQSMKEIKSRFEEESSVQLRDFFKESWRLKIDVATEAADKSEKLGRGEPALNYNVGVSKDWQLVGPAHKQRFLQYTGEAGNDQSAGSTLQELRQSVLQSPQFGRYLGWITSLGTPLGFRGRVRRFRPGLDYTVAHYGVLTTKPVLDATLCFVAGNGKQCQYDATTGDLIGHDDDATWESGDVGGFECYIAADDDDEEGESGKEDAVAEDEYNEDDDTELLSVSASNNTLSLVYRDPGTMRFVKYVGSGAPSSRWDVSMEYQVEDANQD